MVALVGFLSLTVGGIGRADVAATTEDPDIVVAADATEADRALVEWAVGRFDAAGLEPPALTITFHDEYGPCAGNMGRYREGNPARIDICVPDGSHQNCHRLTMLHELGHAWAEHLPTSADRAAFLAERGLDTWCDPDCPAHEWGAEHAAEVISWALMEQPIPIVRIWDAEPARLAAGFEALTGRPPLVTGWTS